MKTEEGIMKEMFASKLVKAATDIFLAELEAIKAEKEEEEYPVTLRIQYCITAREEVITIPQASLCDLESGHLVMQTPDERWAVSTRTQGPLAGKAIRLSDNYDWKLGTDDTGIPCLVPIKKDVKISKKDIIGYFEPR